MGRAIREHLRDFVALLVLLLIAIGVSSYILSNQRLYLPAWVPGIGTSFYEVNAEFSTAQAVVPGQGQTVDIAGVPVGELGEVNLRNGVATVQLKIREKYAPIYKDAHMLLRPKTGLKDMIVEMDPGTKGAGELPEGGTIPVENTAPDVNLDEILQSLDADTRTYLTILVNGGGEGLAGKDTPAALRETFKRFEPTNRDLARITGLLAQRRKNLSRVVHNFGLISNELATRDGQLSQFVASANANFRALAHQEGAIRESLSLLPDTLQVTQTTLVKADALANELGPTLQALRPTARNLGPALVATRPFLRTTTPVIENQLRPFARDVRPSVKALRRAANYLQPLIPKLTTSFRVVNALFNTLAFNPKGSEEGYLFWGSWVNHAGATIFGTQDAHGPIRRGLVITSCSSLGLLETITANNPQLQTLFELLNAPSRAQVCGGPVPDSPKAKAKQGAGPQTADRGPRGGDPKSPDASEPESPTAPRQPAPEPSRPAPGPATPAPDSGSGSPSTGGAAPPAAAVGGGR
jgi:phospholipid/cholesterol/gamma-HCH transport system substrate-binding protein